MDCEVTGNERAVKVHAGVLEASKINFERAVGTLVSHFTKVTNRPMSP